MHKINNRWYYLGKFTKNRLWFSNKYHVKIFFKNWSENVLRIAQKGSMLKCTITQKYCQIIIVEIFLQFPQQFYCCWYRGRIAHIICKIPISNLCRQTFSLQTENGKSFVLGLSICQNLPIVHIDNHVVKILNYFFTFVSGVTQFGI